MASGPGRAKAALAGVIFRTEPWPMHRGVDNDGDRLDVIVAIEDGLIVVTLFG